MKNVRISGWENVRMRSDKGMALPLPGFKHSQILKFSNCLILLLFAHNVFSQSVSVNLKADSTRILIGDQLNVKLTLKHSKGLRIELPAHGDTLGNMDIVTAGKMDTGSTATDRVLTQTFAVSAFDSGTFHAGPVMVLLKNVTGKTDTILSNEIPISVLTLPVDTTKAIKPIKAPLDVPYSWKEFVPYIIGAWVLLASLVIAFVLWRKYRKVKPLPVAKPKPKDPAHVWARAELKKLEEEKLWQKDEVKLYYTRLTDILRMYLEYRYDWLALESTTEEIQAAMPDYNLKEKAKESLLEILRNADLVKFAKLLPMPDVNIRMMENAYKFIDFTEPKETKPEGK